MTSDDTTLRPVPPHIYKSMYIHNSLEFRLQRDPRHNEIKRQNAEPEEESPTLAVSSESSPLLLQNGIVARAHLHCTRADLINISGGGGRGC